MNIFALLWLQSSTIFDPVQKLFNYSFWTIFEKKFSQHATNKTVLDLACGTGELSRHINPKKYLGLDVNQNHIKHSNKNKQNLKFKFIQQNISTQPLPTNYNTAFFISAAHHLSDTDIKKLILNIKSSDLKTVIIIDGYPKKYFSIPLKFLDSFLAGGKYFRTLNQIKKLVMNDFFVTDSGVFTSKLSAYQYPYLILQLKKI